jgi:hypothetical protein
MSAHLSRLRLFQRHLLSLVWVWVWVWDWLHSHTPPRKCSPSSRHPPFTHHPLPLHSLVCGGQPSPHKPRLVVSHSTCPPLSSSPHANSFVLGTAVINTHTSQFLSVPGLKTHHPTARNETTDGPRAKKVLRKKRQWLLHVADTREGGRAWRQTRDEKGDSERRQLSFYS